MTSKIYVLLDHTRPNAPIFQQINKDQRVRLNTRNRDMLYLRQVITDAEGRQKVIRLKLNSNTIFQDEQIKDGIPANEPFTKAEREAATFYNGQKIVNKEIVQKYFDATPENEAFGGFREPGLRAKFKHHDPELEHKSNNEDFKKRLKAGNKIANLTLEQGQELMIRLNGAYFEVPKTQLEVENRLIEYVNEADEQMLDRLLEDNISVDEETVILVGKLVNAEIVSFDEVPNQVVKKKGSGVTNLKQISSVLDHKEREALFVEFLTSAEGKPVLENLKLELNKFEKPIDIAPPKKTRDAVTA